MAITRYGRSLTMTEDGDEIARGNVFVIDGLTLQGGTMTAGQRLRLTAANGDIVCDYVVAADAENVDLWNGRARRHYNGLLLEDGPADGTWVLTVFLA